MYILGSAPLHESQHTKDHQSWQKKVCQHHVKEGLIKGKNKAIHSEPVQPLAQV